MKQILFIVNALFVIVILGLYGSAFAGVEEDNFILGLAGQFVLGVFQLIVAAVLMVTAFRKQQILLIRLLQVYWGCVLTYFLVSFVWYRSAIGIIDTDFGYVFIGGIPMSIAIYQVYITYLNMKEES